MRERHITDVNYGNSPPRGRWKFARELRRELQGLPMPDPLGSGLVP
jgi:hypothetical protein